MAQNSIGKIPDFSSDDSREPSAPAIEEVIEGGVESAPEADVETSVLEKVTPEPPAEKPTEEVATLGDSTRESTVVQDTEDPKDKAITGLQQERVKLIREIADLRGQKREIKQEQIARVDQQIDELKDLNPGDVELIERVIRSKGFVSKTEANQMFYKAVEQEELSKFLERYPEYKPENDPNDINWSALQKELSLYKMPSNPKQVTEILERAHRAVPKIPSSLSIPVQKRKLEVASQGHGGAERPSPNVAKTFDSDTRSMLRNGGFTEEDIKDMESRRG